MSEKIVSVTSIPGPRKALHASGRAHREPPTTVAEMQRLAVAAAEYLGKPVLAKLPDTPTNPEQWHGYASWIANLASDVLHPIRRDFIVDDELGLVVYYDKNSARDRRDHAHEVLRVLLAMMDVEILATASYPNAGEGASYTTALVLRGVVDVPRIRRAVSA